MPLREVSLSDPPWPANAACAHPRLIDGMFICDGRVWKARKHVHTDLPLKWCGRHGGLFKKHLVLQPALAKQRVL